MKEESEDTVLRYLHEDVERRRIRRRQPRTAKSLLSDVLSRKGYAEMLSTDRRDEVWRRVAGVRLARASRLGRIQKGVLTVVVQDSVVLHELSLQKQQIVKLLRQEAPEMNVAGIKLRIGVID